MDVQYEKGRLFCAVHVEDVTTFDLYSDIVSTLDVGKCDVYFLYF